MHHAATLINWFILLFTALKTFPETLRQLEQQQTDETAQALSFKGTSVPATSLISTEYFVIYNKM